jgi:hypothetical protein
MEGVKLRNQQRHANTWKKKKTETAKEKTENSIRDETGSLVYYVKEEEEEG